MDPSQLSGVTQLCGAGSAFAALRQAASVSFLVVFTWRFHGDFMGISGFFSEFR
jgi:hypothetical protein